MTDHDPDHDPNLDPDHDFEDLAHWDDDHVESEPLPDTGVGSLAPIWARAIARVIDLFIVGVGGLFVAQLFGYIEVVDDETVTSDPLGVTLVVLAVWCLYEVVGTLGGGRTVGKFVLGLRVRSVAVDRPPTPFKAMSRWLLQGISLLLGQLGVILLLVVYLTAATQPTRQGIHDRLANTVVVRAR
jgi:uncharacterized RDD family membrane protein YckC